MCDLLRYPYVPDYHVAMLVGSGCSFHFALFVPGTLLCASFLYLLFALAARLSGRQSYHTCILYRAHTLHVAVCTCMLLQTWLSLLACRRVTPLHLPLAREREHWIAGGTHHAVRWRHRRLRVVHE